jgi:glycosyltransferase involved in cell wall biosynthesis
MRDIIFISLENWDGVWRRNQFLCAEWMRRFPQMRILFVGRPRDASHALRTGAVDSFKAAALRQSDEFKGLTLLNPLKLMPNSFAVGRHINSQLLSRQVKSAVKKAGLRQPLLWINDHFAAHLVGNVGERAAIYDITDDWALMGVSPSEERQRVRVADAEMCAKADLVVVCSEALENSRRAKCRRIVRVSNGVDADHYPVCRVPRARGAIPVFGYLGTLHGERLDFGLIQALATSWPQCRVVLCGPCMLTEHESSLLGALSNVEVHPEVHYREVPRVLASFDVCILPHRKTPFTESLNPIKLWEYLASGRAIAATSVAGFRDFAHLCNLGDGAAGFVAACHAAYREDGAKAEARVAVAEANSWRSRVEDLVEVFRQESWVGASFGKWAATEGMASGEHSSDVAMVVADSLIGSMREVALESNWR